MSEQSNPFRERAIRARAAIPSTANAHDTAMAHAFPLGAGYGRAGGSKRIERTIDRACAYVEAVKRAEYLEAQADAYDRGEINAQGRAWNAEKQAKAEARESASERRAERIKAARAAMEGKRPHEVPCEVYADSTGYLAGSARRLVEADWARYAEEARTSAEAGKPFGLERAP